jgi:hypothetical protein
MKRIIDRQSDYFKNHVIPETKRILVLLLFTFVFAVGVLWFLEVSDFPLYPGFPPTHNEDGGNPGNRVDRENHDSFVRANGVTLKFSKTTKEFVVVEKEGTVTTYF